MNDAGAGDEVVVRVKLDGSAAKQELKSIESQTKQTFGMASKLSTAALGYFFGGIARQATGEMMAYGDIIGRSTPIGRVASEYWAQKGAQRTAMERTADAFGLAGKAADEQQIKGVFGAFRQIEELRASSRENVLRTIGSEITDEAAKSGWKDLTYAMNNLGSVIKEFVQLMKLR
jgi:hypothetical protein